MREKERSHPPGVESTSQENQEIQRHGQTGRQMVNSKHGFHEALKCANIHSSQQGHRGLDRTAQAWA